jgi:hypothetical protein
MFGWFKKHKEKKRINKTEWKRAIFLHAQNRLIQVKRIMDAEGDKAGSRKIQGALLTTIIACNRNVKGIKSEDN